MRQVLLDGRPLRIFPCRPDKKPACEHGFEDAVADQAGIDRLWAGVWQRNRPALIGVATGAVNDIAVLDIDISRGGDRWHDANRGRLPTTRTHRTRSGGHHLIYRHVQGLGCSTDRIAPGVEVKADGGYIVWWPDVVCEGPVAEFPRWILDRLGAEQNKRRGDATDATLMAGAKELPRDLYFQVLRLVPLSASISLRDQRRVRSWLAGVVYAPEGSRNDWLFWAACRFGEFAGRIAPEVAEELLFAAASGLVADDGDQSVLTTIASGLRTGSATSVASVAAPHFDDWLVVAKELAEAIAKARIEISGLGRMG